jgi:hypothetical protein
VIVPVLEDIGYKRREILPHRRDVVGRFPDYSILPDTEHAWYLEAKSWSESLRDGDAQQSLNYANQNGRRWVALSNGQRWRLYDNDVRGTASEKFVVEVQLTDLESMEAFLRAASRDSAVRDGFAGYATRCRLEKILTIELVDESSDLFKVLWNALRKRSGLTGVSRGEVRHFLRNLLSCAGAPAAAPVPSVPSPTVAETTATVGESAGDTVPLDAIAEKAGEYATNRQPVAVRFGDDSDVGVDSWAGLAATVVTWIGGRRPLPSLPFSGTSRDSSRYFLSPTPEHPNRQMTRAKRLSIAGSDVFLDSNRSGADFVQRLRALCDAVDINPASIVIRIAPSAPAEWDTVEPIHGAAIEDRADPPPRSSAFKPPNSDERTVGIVLTSSAIEHGLLPTRASCRSFFPGYKVKFALETDTGELTVWVTSNSSGRHVEIGDPSVGQYIQGGLVEWFRARPQLKPGDRVSVTAVDPPRRYRLSVAD